MLEKTYQHSLEFVASMTVRPSDILKIQKHLSLAQVGVDPLRSVLITPLFASARSLELVRGMKQEGRNVVFDSGGYYVQTGRLSYEDLYLPLLKVYKSHRWASIYTLPDHVPTSRDTPDTVKQKVQDTLTYSTLFFHELPDELKSRAMPVVQGHTFQQIDKCLETYLKLGVSHIGFGSFGTNGKNNEVNVATNSAIDLAQYVIQIAHTYGIKVHIFGLGAPALVAMLKGIQADSFDSSSWLKSAGFGQIFLPFMRSYNISHNSVSSEIQQGITLIQFQKWRELTGHHCGLCEQVIELQRHKMYRAVHNLIVLGETIQMVNQGKLEKIQQIYTNGSSKYRQEFQRWLQPS